MVVRRVIGGMVAGLRRQVGGTRLAWVLVAVLLVTVAVLAGVIAFDGDGGGRGDTTAVSVGGAAIPGANQEFDGCALVHRLEAQEILRGRVFLAEKPVEHVASATCVWEVREVESPRSLQLSVFRGDEFFDPAGFEDDETFEELEGIGVEAFVVAPSGVQLHFRTAEFSVVVSVDGVDGGGALDAEAVKRELVGLAARMVEQL